MPLVLQAMHLGLLLMFLLAEELAPSLFEERRTVRSLGYMQSVLDSTQFEHFGASLLQPFLWPLQASQRDCMRSVPLPDCESTANFSNGVLTSELLPSSLGLVKAALGA